MKATGKNIVVTGGGNGVGRQVVLKLLEKGAVVYAIDINEEALRETAKISKNSKRLFTYVVDISNKERVFSFADQVIQEHGKVDGLINNAGIIQPFIHLNELDMDRIERVMNINFYGTLYMVKAFLPHFLKRPEAHIVNVSSMGGFLPVPGQSIYGASKAAVKLMTEGLSSELIDTNVKVSVVIPGGIATDIKKNSGIKYNVSTDSSKSNMVLTPAKAAVELIKSGEKYDEVIAIGPLIMMKFVSALTKDYGIKTMVSMNLIMIDGTGMCGGCRLTVVGKTKFACVDGPDFHGHLVDFDEALGRGTMYKEFERKAHVDACNLYKKGVQ